MSLPDEARSSTNSSAARSRWSLSNGLSSLLSPKGSHVNSFSIELEDISAIKKYGPGETVRGKVVLDVARPLGVTHIVVSLLGYAQVFRNHSRTSASQNRFSPNRGATGKGKRWVSEYYGDGYMSLFEEEVVLCGEGRLDPKYSPFHFHFDLEFPAHLALPSNIDFDKGTITYLVSSTLTRPAYTTPTLNCQAKIGFLEDIDVAMLPPPKPRVATLRPEPPSASPRTNLKRLTSQDAKRVPRSSSASNTVQSSQSVQSQPDVANPGRPSRSVASTESSSSRERRRSIVTSEPRSFHTTASSLNGKPHRFTGNITVSAQLYRGGCLPGHYVPLLIKIQHNKIVRNPSGILVTLYRQARVDMHPHLPLASTEKRAREKYEDYYPRSRTGLGGLSLSAAGSSQRWRKDMSQTTAPLYIDEQTKSAEIKAGVIVPELPEAFPSIRNVPGHMISFRYMVEVIIDIHGKMIGHNLSSGVSNASAGTSASPTSNVDPAYGEQADRTKSAIYEGNLVDTTRLRRDKNAVTVECELIIGTRDSERKGKQRKGEPLRDSGIQQEGYSENASTVYNENGEVNDGWNSTGYEDGSQWEPRWDEDRQRWLYVDEVGLIYDEDWNFVGYDQAYEEAQTLPGFNDGPELIAPPEFEQDISEKERLRRAEQSLLPSRPPGEAEAENSSRSGTNVPTAPDLTEENSPASPAPSTLRLETGVNPNELSTTSAVHDFASPAQVAQTSSHETNTVPSGQTMNRSEPEWTATANEEEYAFIPTAPSFDEIDRAAEERVQGNEERAQAVVEPESRPKGDS